MFNINSVYRFILILIIPFLLCLPGTAQTVDELILMSEHFPPYNYTDKGTTLGISVDIVELILHKLRSKKNRKDIIILPWARSYRDLKMKRNTVLFVVTKTPERSPLFKWVGPLSMAKNVLIAKKNFKGVISKETIRKYRVGVVQDDAGQQLMTLQFGLGKNELKVATNAKINIRKLNKGRIDLFAYDENVTRWLMSKEDLDYNNFKSVHILNQNHHYIAFHKDTPNKIIQKWQNALDQLHSTGVINGIISRYLDSKNMDHNSNLYDNGEGLIFLTRLVSD